MIESATTMKLSDERESTPQQSERRLKLLRRLLSDPASVVGLSVLIILIVCAIGAPFLAPLGYDDQMPQRRLLPPWSSFDGQVFLLGTDQLGRDMLSRIIFGAQVSLLVGAVGVLIGGVIGVTVGLVAGWSEGWTGSILMRFTDVQLAFPYLLLAIAVVAVLQPSLWALVIVLSLRAWVGFARVVRGSVLSIKPQEYVAAARVCGASSKEILLRHVLPNIVAPITVLATAEFASLILLEATLSFLGLGIQPPFPSWGTMLSDGRTYLLRAWWLGVFPGVAIMIAVLGANLLGDGLRDALDPRVK